MTNSCATAWMQSDFVWHINLHKGAAIVAMQISHEISYCARFGVELSCRWQQTFVGAILGFFFFQLNWTASTNNIKIKDLLIGYEPVSH